MKNKKILLIISIIIVLMITLLPLYKGRNLFNIINEKRNYYALSDERQQAYDKMKIEYLNIKSRVTGTAPFNSGTTSNANGVDVSATDNYVRTFDVMKYTVELGIAPNTSHSGVTNSSVYEGGVIKVRAKLPNQSNPKIMTWGKDAWMQNVTLSDDKTEIYAEYHVPSGVSITNANQNLSFTIKIDGYKKTITSAMAPEFEVWMEGNAPDDASSGASSKTAKDTRTTIISGNYSFDYTIRGGVINNYGVKNGVEGHYVDYGVLAKLYQPYSNISDLRGVLYPTGKITITLTGEYKYFYSNEEGGWIKITDSNNLLNNTQMIAFTPNNVEKEGFYPAKMWYLENSVGGKRGSTHNSVFDSGTVNATINQNIMNVSFENYKFDGIYPKSVMNSSATAFSSREGVFGSANIEIFVPYYNPLNKSHVDNQVNFKITKVTIDGDNYVNGGTSTYSDGMTNDSVTTNLIKRNGNMYSPLRTRIKTSTSTYLSTNYYSEDAATVIGDEFIAEAWTRATDGPYYGGMDNLISWNCNFFELKKYTLKDVEDSESMFDVQPTNDLGFDIIPTTNIKVSYGIYKANRTNGITTNEQSNAALYSDFDWYNSYSTASTHGTVSAVYVNDPDNIGQGNRRYIRFKFQAKNNVNNIGKIGIFRHRTRYYGDANRTEVYYFRGESSYTASNAYSPSVYDAAGNITSVAAPEELGETILMLGVKTGVSITTLDTDSNGIKKKAYDVQDSEINLKITPTLSNGQDPKDSDKYYNNVTVKAILPNGLSYQNGTASKAPKRVTVNADGTTTIEWEYNNWQVNHAAPDFPTITFKADISASLENNESLSIQSKISHAEDLRDEKQFRTSEYGVVISNLAGAKALKTINKTVVEKNEKFTVTSVLGNNSEEVLRNIKTIEILPYNNDNNNSKFNGTYTTKITSKIDNQKIYYTTHNIAAIGLTEDQYGKLTIKDVDLGSDSRWTEVQVGETIPSNATAIATSIPSLPSKTEKSFAMEVTPSNNKETNTYGFSLNMTTDNLIAAIKTNTVVTTVVNRKISGKVFIDKNRNNQYDTTDELVNNNIVKLLNSSGTVVDTTQTNSNGEYEFTNIDKGTYYIQFSIMNNYEVITKGTSSKANSDGKTDIINNLNVVPTTSLIEVKDIDMGIRKISATIHVRYEEYNNSSHLFDSTEIDKYYGDSYNLDEDYTPNIPDNYELKQKTSNYAGTVNSKDINIVYYYQKKDSKLTSSIEKSGPVEITSKKDTLEYNIEYKTKVTDYLGEATITITDKLPYTIDVEKSNLNGGTYNPTNKTVTWTIPKTITSINEPEIVINKKLELVFTNINPKEREFINIVEGKIVLDNNERTIENTFKTDLKIPGVITVKYIEVNDDLEYVSEIAEREVIRDLVGEEYTTKEKSIEGYLLIERPELEQLEIQEEEQIVIYKYQKIKLQVETVVHGPGGKIKGNEIIYYGEDSTKDKIVINSEPGYVIEKLIINEEEIDIAKGKDKFVVDNFINMKESKLVVVSFMKKPPTIKNPATGIIIVMITIYTIMLLSTIIYTFLINKRKALS